MANGPVLGIIGGGQLARMMAAAAVGLGLPIRLFAEGPDTSAAQVVRDTTVGDYTDAEAVLAWARGLTAVTFDHEHVPDAVLRALEDAGVAVRPGPDALQLAADKAVMRWRLSSIGIPCPAWRVVGSPAELAEFASAQGGWPVIAKVSRGGYDGKGVWKVTSDADAHLPFEALERALGPTERTAAAAEPHDAVILAEEFVPFVRELSVLLVRGADGAVLGYDITETEQRDGVCRETLTPAPALDEARIQEVYEFATAIADEAGVVGLLAVELMEAPDGRILVNELAMRPHNTGHWTLDGAHTSQFENHIRAAVGLPLGATSRRAPWVVMSNVLGGANRDLEGTLGPVFDAFPGVRVQLYGKSVQPGRKVGHVTAYGTDREAAIGAALAASEMMMSGPGGPTKETT